MSGLRLEELIDAGFDGSSEICDEDDMEVSIRVRCTQCAVAIISGVACHELGCPNAAQAKRRKAQEEVEDGDD